MKIIDWVCGGACALLLVNALFCRGGRATIILLPFLILGWLSIRDKCN